MGSDHTDCWRLRQGVEDDTCQLALSGRCDEAGFGTGACTSGTDHTDCAQAIVLRWQSDSCPSAFNGRCEDSSRGGRGCAPRTDRSDCIGRDRPMTINDHFFGNDDRVRVDVQQAPWRFMGRFINSAGERCTATLVARNVILTAAHCIENEEGVHARGTFIPAAGGATARSIAYLTDERFDFVRFATSSAIDGTDWALLRLDTPLGDTLGYARIRAFSRREIAAPQAVQLLQAGFAWDTGETLAAHIGCSPIRIYADSTFAHTCDSTHGDSGSALIVRTRDAYQIVGVDSQFRLAEGEAAKYLAVSAASFVAHLPDFAAERTGFPADR